MITLRKQQHVLTLRPLQVYGDQRAEVPLRVLVRVEVAGEAGVGQVVDGPHVLLVRRRLALARHPHHVGLPTGTHLN